MDQASYQQKLCASDIFKESHAQHVQSTLTEVGIRQGEMEYEQKTMIHIYGDAIMKFTILYPAFKI